MAAVASTVGGSAISDPGLHPRPDTADGATCPDAELIAALDDAAGRAVLAALRSGPQTVAELVAATGLDDGAVWSALHVLTEQGVLTADHPRLPGPVAYRIDGGAFTGFRGLGRWFRTRSAPPAGHRAVDGRDQPPDADAGARPGDSRGDSATTTLTSVAAWTNPAVTAALQRLERQHRPPP